MTVNTMMHDMPLVHTVKKKLVLRGKKFSKIMVYGKPFSKTCILVFWRRGKKITVQSGNLKASN